MSLTLYPQNWLPANSSPIDASGRFTKDVQFLLLAFFNRTGAGAGAPNVQSGLVVTAGQDFGIVGDWNDFTTVPAAGAALLPSMAVGADCIVWNSGANALNVKPQPGAQIDVLGAGSPYSLGVAKMQWFRGVTMTQIRSMQLG